MSQGLTLSKLLSCRGNKKILCLFPATFQTKGIQIRLSTSVVTVITRQLPTSSLSDLERGGPKRRRLNTEVETDSVSILFAQFRILVYSMLILIHNMLMRGGSQVQ